MGISETPTFWEINPDFPYHPRVYEILGSREVQGKIPVRILEGIKKELEEPLNELYGSGGRIWEEPLIEEIKERIFDELGRKPITGTWEGT